MEKSISSKLPGFQEGFVTLKHASIMKSDFKAEKSCLAAAFFSLCLDSSLLSLVTETPCYAFLFLRKTCSSGNRGAGGFWFPTALRVAEEQLLRPLSPLTPSHLPVPKPSPLAAVRGWCRSWAGCVPVPNGGRTGEDQQPREALCSQNWARKSHLG